MICLKLRTQKKTSLGIIHTEEFSTGCLFFQD